MNSNPISYAIEDRKKRCQLYFKAAVEAARDWYDQDGKWIAGKPEPGTRDRYWLAFALYAVGEKAWADVIVRQGDTDGTAEARGRANHFNIFWTNIAIALLKAHGDKIGPEAKVALEIAAKAAFGFMPGDRSPDYNFQGYNDNMPSKASMGLIIAGEMFGNDEAVQHGLGNLRALRDQLTRRGIHSEYNSPTYTPGTLLGMSKIAEYARNEEARDIALKVEHRLWIDLAARVHPGMGLASGPHSRAYTLDTLGFNSGLSCMLWFALGDYAKPSPMEFFNPKTPLALHHQGDLPFNISGTCWMGVTHYHIPEAALRLFEKKQYPFRAVATAEIGDAGLDWPARPVRIESYLEKDFTVGTASTPWLSGEQAASYFVTYKRKQEVKAATDYGTIHTKLVINDAVPGAFKEASTRADGTPYSEFIEQDNLDAKSNHITLQSGPTVLFLSHPHLALGGNPDFPEKPVKPLSRLSELVIFQSQFGGAEEILVGGEARSEWSGEVAHGQWIAMRRGRLFVAYRMLTHTAGFGQPKITLEKINRYEVIRTDLYRAEERTFTRPELKYLLGGFLAEHASIDEYGSVREFVADLEKSQFTDFVFTTRRVRYRRPKGLKREALELETSWSTGSHETRFSSINGQLVSWPIVEIDGIDPKSLPFLDGQWQSCPGHFPWPKLEVATFDTVASIGDKDQ
jgi:hypothetical protein